MPCYHPITAWYGEKTASGKRRLTFSPNGGHGSPIEINCGQCIGCRLERARQWSIRIVHEAQFYDETAFLTLTYAPENVPANGSLVVRHLQLFHKRLRSRLGSKRVRFFAVGEYGEQLSRPHYHSILFGHAFLEDRKPWSKGSRGDQVFVSPLLDEIWGLGHCYIGSVSLQSAGYVARYTTKKVLGDMAKDHYGELHPEFMVCSNGIGKKFFDWYHGETYRDGFVVHKGKKAPVPRYYDKQLAKLYGDDVLTPIKEQRKRDANKHWRNQTPRRLADREEVTKAKILSLKRS